MTSIQASVRLIENPMRADIVSTVIAIYLCVAISITLVISVESAVHWFILPLTVCGILIMIDAVNWIRGRVDVFDPIGVIGLLGVHFFFLAPILHITWDYWMKFIIPPPDWRPWLGAMAVFNIVGLIVYRWIRQQPRTHSSPSNSRKFQWQLNEKRFWRLVTVTLAGTALLQSSIYAQFGGISGYIQAYSSAPENFKGFGILFMLSESFPILAMMAFTVRARRQPALRTWFVIAMALTLLLGLQLLFGGLRGSRSNTIWALFWGVGMIHLLVRPISRKFIILGIIFLVGFMYFYGFYKGAKVDLFESLAQGATFSDLEAQTGRTMEGAVLGDLGRSDVQALLLYKLSDPKSNYRYGYGRTYLGAAALLIPASLWPDRPTSKLLEGTEILYGAGAYEAGMRSSRVYGLAGETMLNFGPYFIPLAFGIWGLLVRYIRSIYIRFHFGSPWLFILPALINLSFIVLTADSDNLVFFVVKNIFLPFVVIIFSSSRVYEDHRSISLA